MVQEPGILFLCLGFPSLVTNKPTKTLDMYLGSMGNKSEPPVSGESWWWQATGAPEVSRKAFPRSEWWKAWVRQKRTFGSSVCQMLKQRVLGLLMDSHLTQVAEGYSQWIIIYGLPRLKSTRRNTVCQIAVGPFPSWPFYSLNTASNSSLFPLLLSPHLTHTGSRPRLTLMVTKDWENAVGLHVWTQITGIVP